MENQVALLWFSLSLTTHTHARAHTQQTHTGTHSYVITKQVMTSVIKMTSKGTGRKSNVQRPTVSKAMG